MLVGNFDDTHIGFGVGLLNIRLSNGAQTGPRIGVEEGPPFRD